MLRNNPHKAHKRVSLEDCHEAYIDLFRSNRHNPNHLAERIITFSQRRSRNLGRLQQIAYDQNRKDPVFAPITISALPTATQIGATQENVRFSNQEIISKHFQFFNRMFFFGALKDTDIAIEGGGGAGAECNGLKTNYEIVLHRKHNASRALDLQEYIGMLLHEMIHAFMNRYACKYCIDGPEALGKTGHGWVWMDVAAALETACKEMGLLGMEMRTGMNLALAMEIAMWDKVVPKNELGRWGLDADEVERALRTLPKSTMAKSNLRKLQF